MLVEDGVVKELNLEEPVKFDVSGADKMLIQVQARRGTVK